MSLDVVIGLYEDNGTLTWVGTVGEFWEANQDGYLFGEIRDLVKAVEGHGFARVGGGAAPLLTIRKMALSAAFGWMREREAKLAQELKELADYYECYRKHQGDKVPSDAIARARAALEAIQ